MIQKKKVNGVWQTDGSTLKTDINIIEKRDLPDPILPGDTPLLIAPGVARGSSSSALSPTSASLTIPRDGTYRIKWFQCQPYEVNTARAQLAFERNGVRTTIGQEQSIRSGSTASYSIEYTFKKNDVVLILHKPGYEDSLLLGFVGGLCACIDWNNGF